MMNRSQRRPHRLVAQDVGFSARKPGFDSPWGYMVICTFIARASNASSSNDEAFCVCGPKLSPVDACCVALSRISNMSRIGR